MSDVHVIRSRDGRRWRIEIRAPDQVDLYEWGHLVLRRVSMDRVGTYLAERGVDLSDFEAY